MANVSPRWLRQHFVVVGYVLAACASVPVLIYGFLAWRDEGFYLPHKHSALEGRGGGFYTFLVGFMLIAFAALGLQYHFTRIDRPPSDTDRDDKIV